MADPHAEAIERAAKAFNAASDHFDGSPIWSQVGAKTIRRLRLEPGQQVADLCAGTGASAIPAAHAVGPTGHVLALDVAGAMLALIRAKADAAGLTQLETRLGDASRTGLPAASYDAVVCVFGVFFVPDMAAFVREMWRLVRPGGQVAITNWGEVVFQPIDRMFKDALHAEAPEHAPPADKEPPWVRIATPEGMAALFASAGTEPPVVVSETVIETLDAPEDAWHGVAGSGSRGVIEAIDPDRRGRVRRHLIDSVAAAGVTDVRSDVLYAVATKRSREL